MKPFETMCAEDSRLLSRQEPSQSRERQTGKDAKDGRDAKDANFGLGNCEEAEPVSQTENLKSMGRPPTPLTAGWANKSYVMQIWNDVMPPRRRRLHMLMLIWDASPGETRTRLSEMLGITRRQLSRWVAAYNRGGIDELIRPPRQRPGRRPKLSAQDFNSKVFPLVEGKRARGIPWTVAKIHQQLGAEHNIHVSVSTLRRRLAGSGFTPMPRPSKPKQQSAWDFPWPREYGTCLADFLEKSGKIFERDGKAFSLRSKTN